MNTEKLVYFYWGGERMPLLNALSIISFKKFNPDYKIVLYQPKIEHNEITWTTGEQTLMYTGKDYYHTIDKLIFEKRYIDFEKIGFSNNIHNAQKADILRQWILLNYGGWWSDMDIIWTKNLSLLNIENIYDITVCFRNGYHSSAVMYSKPNTLFYKKIFEKLKTSFFKQEYQSAGPSLLNGMYPSIELINVDCNNSVYNFEYDFFYHFYDNFNFLYNTELVEYSLPTNIFGVHWYNGNNLSRKFSNEFDYKNVNSSNIVMYKILKSILNDSYICSN